MIKHIVMFKLKTFSGKAEKMRHANALKNALDALPVKIPEIRFYEVGLNVADSPRAFDMVLISHFNSEEDLDIYRVHPDHKKVLEQLQQVCEQIVVVDY